MTVTAAQVGRDLHLTVEGVADPFVIAPLPGRVGKTLTDKYIECSAGGDATGMEELLMISVDGGTVGDDGTLIPHTDLPNYQRIGEELSLAEAQDVLLPAFFWQTILGIRGVNIYLEAGGGDAGGVKALWALLEAMAISPSRTSPSSALETLTQSQASTRPTSTRKGGRKPGRQPLDRLRRKRA